MSIFRLVSLITLMALTGLAAWADPMEITPVTVKTADAEHVFTVEVANDDEEVSFGLMFRDSLAAEEGMLFDFGNPRIPSMYMKNTLIPLDMLFIDTSGEITMIGRNAVPGSLRTISPPAPVLGVLEIKGGLASELGIEPGDTVLHPMFGNVEDPSDE